MTPQTETEEELKKMTKEKEIKWTKIKVGDLNRNYHEGFLAGQNSQKEKDLEMIEEIDNPQFISHYGDTQEKRLAILIYVKEFKKILKQKIGDGK